MIDIKKKKEKTETKTEAKRRVNKDSLTAEDSRENSKSFERKHLKTDYAASEQRIKELEKGGIKTVPCRVTSEDDYYRDCEKKSVNVK